MVKGSNPYCVIPFWFHSNTCDCLSQIGKPIIHASSILLWPCVCLMVTLHINTSRNNYTVRYISDTGGFMNIMKTEVHFSFIHYVNNLFLSRWMQTFLPLVRHNFFVLTITFYNFAVYCRCLNQSGLLGQTGFHGLQWSYLRVHVSMISFKFL